MSLSVSVIIMFVALSSVGAFIRFYFTSDQVGFPWLTIMINLLGCFLIGIVYSLKVGEVLKGSSWMFIAIAFLGSLTTFSSYSLDMMKLISNKSYMASFNYFVISNLFGLVLCYLGYLITYKFLNH